MAIKIKGSSVSGRTPLPADLLERQLAVNTADGYLFTKHSDGTIKDIKVRATNVPFTASGGILSDNVQGALQELDNEKATLDSLSSIGVLLPSGAVSFFATTTPPTGWLKANGAAISRTTYAALFNAIGITFGAGDGSTTFNLPDLRGQFLRAFDDGRGVDAGRGFGSTQGDAIRNITGALNAGLNYTATNPSGAFTVANVGNFGASGDFQAPQYSFNFDASRVVPTANENRPTNAALLACIKF
jgi:phage-related tail fiber protein